MTGERDMSAPNWARTLPRLQRNAAELREYGWEVNEPPNVETPPGRRQPTPSRKRGRKR